MNMTYNEVCAMNEIQLQLLREFIKVCKQLNLTYYMVHGSLLGAYRYENFFPYDDDIDVAMPRKDYDVFLDKGSSLFTHPFFLQSYKTEEEYPLPFAKLRNSNTAFIQPSMKNFNINQGIYIDIFPIDYYPKSKIRLKWIEIREKLYNIRISARIVYNKKQPLWKKFLRAGSRVICPSWKGAIKKRAKLYESISQSGKVIVTGGKIKERGIPEEWFESGAKLNFSKLIINSPIQYKEYLSCIYGDYEYYNPAAKYMNTDGTVMVTADIVSTTRSYIDFL